MIATIHEMAAKGDEEALADVWAILGAESGGQVAGYSSSRTQALVEMIRSACLGKGDIYAAERKALSELAQALEIAPEQYPTVETLEDEIADAMLRRFQKKVKEMSEEEVRDLIAGMLKRMSDEERVRLMDQILSGIDEMTTAEKDAFVKALAEELDVSEDAALKAIEGGVAALIPLLVAKAGGFSVYLLSTQLLHVVFTRGAGLVLPFAVYQAKNRALSWMLGPWGLILTTGLSAMWFGMKTWRRQERIRKLAQLVTYVSFWRRRDDDDPLAGVAAKAS